jgi:GAF domain-containing protein/HAMP domain-containing protein
MNIPESQVKSGSVESDAKTPRRAHNALRIAIIVTIAMLVLASVVAVMAFQYGGWQLSVFAVAAVVLTSILLVGVVLIRLGRVELGVWLLLGAVAVTCLIGSTLVAGLGLALASVTLLALVLAPQALPTKQANWVIAIGVVASAATLLVDVFGLPFRATAPALVQAAVPFVCGAAAAIYGYVLYRQFGSLTLRSKLINAFLLVTLIPLSLLAFLNDRNSRAAYTANIGSGMKALANTQALVIGDELDRQVTELRSLSQNSDLRSAAEASNAAATGTPESIQADIDRLDQQWRAADAANNDNDPLVYPRLNNPLADKLREFRTILPDNVEVFITDKYGALIAATNRTSDYNQADEEWWQVSYGNGQGATYVGPLEYDESSKTYASNVAVPMVAADGKTVVGVLRTTLRLKTLLDTLNVVRLGQTGRMELFIPGGQKLAEAGAEPIPVDEATLARIEAASKSDYVAMTYDGIPSLVSQALVITADPEQAGTIAQLGWIVVVHQDQSEGLTPLRAQTRTTALLLVAIAALVTGAAIGAAQLLSGPITRLTATARQVTGGDVRARARVEAQDEIGTLAGSFNTMVAQLQQTLESLEQRVVDRTRDLEQRAVQLTTVAEVGRAATSTLDPEKLAQETVDLLRERFDLYYAGLFLVDERTEYAVLEAGTGEPGRTMKEQGHKLLVGGTSMVGAVCAERKAHIALDTGAEAVRFANPLLPETRSEMALPLAVGGRVLGALDVQSVRPAAFSEEDIAVMQLAADQVAVAVDNARKFSSEAALLEAASPLFAVSRRLAEVVTTDQAAQAIIDSVALTEADGCAVARFDYSPDDEVATITFLGSWSRSGASRFPVGTPLPASSWMLPVSMMGRFWIITDVLEEAQMPANMRQALAELGTRAVVNVPLQAGPASREGDLRERSGTGGRVIGAVIVQRAVPGPFSPVSLRLYETLAEQAAVVLERARLVEEAQRRAAQERWLSQVSDQMQRAGDMGSLLQVVAEEVNRALGGSRAYVQLGLRAASDTQHEAPGGDGNAS